VDPYNNGGLVNRIKIAYFVVALFAVTLTFSFWNHRQVFAQTLEPPKLQGFTLNEIRFDESEGGKKPTPQIPKSWRFVGVSNGEKSNSNNLWFQDSSGNIYMFQGFTDGPTFIINENVGELHATN